MSQPLLSRLDLWLRHERRVLDVLTKALSLLRIEPGLERDEVALNRKLFFCLLDANDQLWRAGKGGFDHPPVSEGKNPPDLNDEQRVMREDKIPDFLWSFIDHGAADSRRGARHFVIECKRLGSPPSTSWILNANYIHHGVLRFVLPEYGYAKGEASAAMVGYIESMEPDNILAEVNVAAQGAVAPITSPNGGWLIDGVSQLDHDVVRRSPESVLALKHLWVDLRACFDQSSGRL